MGNSAVYVIEGEYISDDVFVGVIQLEIPNVLQYTDCQFEILEIYQDLLTGKEKEGVLPDTGEKIKYIEHDKQSFTGEWIFNIPLESHGNNVERYSIYGRDISSVTVHIFDYEVWEKNKEIIYAGELDKSLFSRKITLKQ